jgi:hypothetical protein
MCCKVGPSARNRCRLLAMPAGVCAVRLQCRIPAVLGGEQTSRDRCCTGGQQPQSLQHCGTASLPCDARCPPPCKVPLVMATFGCITVGPSHNTACSHLTWKCDSHSAAPSCAKALANCKLQRSRPVSWPQQDICRSPSFNHKCSSCQLPCRVRDSTLLLMRMCSSSIQLRLLRRWAAVSAFRAGAI